MAALEATSDQKPMTVKYHRDGLSQLLSDDLHNLLYFAQFIFSGARGSG